MQRLSKLILSISLFIILFGAITCFSGITQDIGADTGIPVPPPVEIELTTENILPLQDTEVILHLTITPLEDMHLDISCILPEGAMPVMAPGIMVHPYKGRNIFSVDDPSADLPVRRDAIILWVGPVVGGETKEFEFRVTIPEAGSYEFTAVVMALAKWGTKEEKLMMYVH